jgi:hypothetical protein
VGIGASVSKDSTSAASWYNFYVTPRVMATLIIVIRTLTMHQIYGLIKLKLRYRKFNLISIQNLHHQVRNS